MRDPLSTVTSGGPVDPKMLKHQRPLRVTHLTAAATVRASLVACPPPEADERYVISAGRF